MNLEEFTINLADQFEDNNRDVIESSTIFKDLDGWDSLTAMLVIAMIKTDYNKDVSATEIRECNSVKDLFDYINKM